MRQGHRADLLREATPTGLGRVYRLSSRSPALLRCLRCWPSRLAYVNPRLGRSINSADGDSVADERLQVMNIVQSLIDRRTLTLPVALFVFLTSRSSRVGSSCVLPALPVVRFGGPSMAGRV